MKKKFEIFWFIFCLVIIICGFGMTFSENAVVELIGKSFCMAGSFFVAVGSFINIYFDRRNKKRHQKNTEISEESEIDKKD